MQSWPGFKLLALAVLSLGTQIASANVTVTLGEQDFADGATPTSGAILAAGAGEPAPFDGVFSGSDGSGPNFSTTWTFSYAAQPSVLGASLTLGIADHESSAPGNQVASFTLNGIDLTSALNVLLEASGGASRENNVYLLTLSSPTFAALGTGMATFSLSLQGPGLGVLGETTFNGAALDFSTLSVTPVPGPATGILMSLALLGLGIARRIGAAVAAVESKHANQLPPRWALYSGRRGFAVVPTGIRTLCR